MATTLLELYAAARDADLKRVLGLALEHQTDPRAFEVYAAEWQTDCEQRRAAAATRARFEATSGRFGLGYWMDGPTRCEVSRLRPAPAPEPPVAQATTAPVLHYTPHVAQLREALTPYGLRERLHRFASDGAGPLGSHAPRQRQMADLVRPELDALVLEEVWPALDAFEFERGARDTWVFVRDGGYHVRVLDRAGEADPAETEALGHELQSALDEPHFVDAYLDGERYRFHVRGLGHIYDVEMLVGAMNTLLRARGSEQRFVVLEPFDFVDLVAGPQTRLRDAIDAGAITPGDPFAAAHQVPEQPNRGRIPSAP